MSKTIADKLLYLYEAKEEIKEAIIDKGVGVLPTDGLKSYATKIGEIEGGGSSPTFPDWPDIKAIVETEDDEVNKYKCLFLLTNDTPEYEYIENYGGIVKIITSDGEEYNNEPFTHVWDATQDINGKYRYIVFYSNNQNFSFLRNYRPIGIAYNDLATKHRTSFNSMFQNCYSLQTIPELNTELGTNFIQMFQNCHSLQTIPELNTELGTSFSYMFSGCYSLQTIPEIDTSSGTDFSSMFYDCRSLQTIPELNTELGTSFNSMFYDCYSLQTIPEIDTSSGTNFSSMFYACSSLQTIPELNTELGTSFSYMFYECYSLQTIPELNTGLGTNFNNMFYDCRSLQTIPELNTELGTRFSSMFSDCYSLQTIYLLTPSFKEAVSFNGSRYLTYDTIIGMFNSLPEVSGKTITITNNSNSKLSVEDKEIATNKGWTISVSG